MTLNANELLSRRQTAEFLGICLTTLDRLDIPRTRIRHRVMYKSEVINKWLNEQTNTSKGGKV